jgi:hypothetical protein
MKAISNFESYEFGKLKKEKKKRKLNNFFSFHLNLNLMNNYLYF